MTIYSTGSIIDSTFVKCNLYDASRGNVEGREFYCSAWIRYDEIQHAVRIFIVY